MSRKNLGREIDLLTNYPKSNRNLSQRLEDKTDEDRRIARQFGKEFFDGKRSQGYGGFSYNERFWGEVVLDFKEYWNLKAGDKILDVGCAKGFMLFDFIRKVPGINVAGIDISDYAIESSMKEVKEFLSVGNAKKLPFENNSFDAVISINTIHNLDYEECSDALREIERVSKGKSFITVDAYRNEAEKKRMYAWNLTAKTILSVDQWEDLFYKTGYTGDYYWFIP